MSEGRAHLYARPLTAERQARADGQQTTGEFDRQQIEWGGRQLAADCCLDVRNGAAHSILTETAHKPCAEGRGRRCSYDQEATAEKRLSVPPHGHGGAETIGLFQRQPEEAAYKPRACPGDRARVGYAYDNWLFYATGGLAVLGAKTNLTGVLGVNPCVTISVIDGNPGVLTCNGTNKRLGGTVGAGLEYGLTPNLSAKLEYLYTAAASLELSHINEVRVGVNYRLGGL
jgi:hypothetical protein